MAIETKQGVEIRRKLTPDDVDRMLSAGELDPDLVYELIDGELIEMPPAKPHHGMIAVRISTSLAVFAKSSGGWVYDSSSGFKVGPDRKDLRAPDVSYIGPKRTPPGEDEFGDGAPNLAIEILSADQYGEAYARTKVPEYFRAGAELVWLIDAKRREVRVYRANSDEYMILRNEAVLTLDPIITGFGLRVSEIFS